MDWKTLLACITGAVDDQLLLRNEYLVTENRIMRQQIQGRVQLTDADRTTLAELGKQLGKQAWEEVANIVKPDTILGGCPRISPSGSLNSSVACQTRAQMEHCPGHHLISALPWRLLSTTTFCAGPSRAHRRVST